MNAILNGLQIAGNVLLPSLRTAAFCWAAGLAAVVPAICCATRSGKRRDRDDSLQGMCRGMCFGLLAGTMLGASVGAAVSIGMIVGLVLGMLRTGHAAEEGE